jgi:multiple sugar transport system substrate-binding protein
MVKSAAAGAAAIATGAQLASAAPAGPSAARITAGRQDKPFAGQKLTVLGPAYHEPYVPEGFIPSFQEKTGAEVEWQTFPGGEEAVKYAPFVVSGDSSVDVLYAWETVVAKFGPVLLEDITGKVSQPVMDDIVPAANAAFLWNGKQYGVPFDSNLTVFMWNTELYQAAGLDPNTPPQNWSEFVDFSSKLTKDGMYGTIFPPGFFPYAIMINSTGAFALSDDLKTVNADSEESKMVIQAMADMFGSGSVDPISMNVPDSIEQGKNFRAGRFAHYIAFPNHYRLAQDPTQSQIVDKAKTGIIPGLKLRSGTSNGIEGYAINKNSKAKDLALAFLEHTMDPEVQKYVALTWGRPPASKTTLSAPDVLEVAPQFQTVLDQAQYPAKRYGSPFYGDLDKMYTEELLKLAKGDATVDETAASIKEKGQKIVDDYWASAS